MKEITKKRLVALATILVSLSLSIIGAASQNMMMGALFGFLLTLGIDDIICSYKTEPKGK